MQRIFLLSISFMAIASGATLANPAPVSTGNPVSTGTQVAAPVAAPTAGTQAAPAQPGGAQPGGAPTAASPCAGQILPGTQLAFPDDPAALLGLSPAQALERFGPPQRVFAVRGAEAWQDDVVFDYGSGFSLFLFRDRVWQIRVAEPYTRPVLGFTVGAAKERVASVLGTPDRELPGAYEWVLPGAAWPVRLRGNFDQSGAIRELYVYRADF